MTTPNAVPLPGFAPNPPGGVSAGGLLQALHAAGATHVVTVPDFVQFALHEHLTRPDATVRQVYACAEDQALTMACGLYVGGATPVVLVQNQGFYKCMNTLRAVCLDAGVPVVFLVGQFGRELANIGQSTRTSTRSMVRLMEPLLDTLGLRYWNLEDQDSLGGVAQAFAHAHTHKTAAVLLVDRHLTWN